MSCDDSLSRGSAFSITCSIAVLFPLVPSFAYSLLKWLFPIEFLSKVDGIQLFIVINRILPSFWLNGLSSRKWLFFTSLTHVYYKANLKWLVFFSVKRMKSARSSAGHIIYNELLTFEVSFYVVILLILLFLLSQENVLILLDIKKQSHFITKKGRAHRKNGLISQRTVFFSWLSRRSVRQGCVFPL